ncbi:MAG: multicopper oxidase family protein [Rhodospirillaceae bacterium]|nr:multicopper oxidase family protein [Rhodospirillaceae bacterium]
MPAASNRVTRRRAILSLGGIVLSSSIARWGWADAAPAYPAAPSIPADARIVDATLTAAPRWRQLKSAPSAILDYVDDGPVVLRVKHGDWLRAKLINGLEEHTSIHWHGIRLPNAMDGVPYLTQSPVQPGESFTYAFQPPDTGTFFFHPHCNTVEQLGRGLAGVLIVDGDEARPHDADLVLVYRDWRIDDTGQFMPMITDAGAAKAGTFGTHRTINDKVRPVYGVPAGGDIRLRFLNLDMTRIVDLGVIGAEAWLIATDGNALPPQKLKAWRMGPAMRADLTLRAPARAGDRIQIVNYYAPEPVVMAELEAVGPTRDRPVFEPVPLRPSRIPAPEIVDAEVFSLRLAAATAPNASADGDLPPDLVLPDGEVLRYADALCLNPDTFWSFNGRSWPMQSHEVLPPPLVTFRQGSSYVIELINQTPHMHPIHLHGHTFKVLSSSKGEVVPHFADTTLVAPKERVRIAIRADNPGDWMIHCHIVEHQDTGMMGIFRVA